MKIVAIIPAYNEEENIVKVIAGVKKYLKNIIVVDDGSKDNTVEAAKAQNITVLHHIINLGKGAALKTGIEYSDADAFILIDADMQHSPEHIPEFIKALEEGHDMVFGYRQINKSMPFILRFGNTVINRSTKYLYSLPIKDSTCGFRAFTQEAYQKIKWNASGYFVEGEMIANAGNAKLTYTQIAIKTIYSDKYKGTTVLDGIKIVGNMIAWKVKKWS